jgi:hypothetical protein
VALFVRPRSLLQPHRATRLAGWWLLLLLAGSCLNPQPDPFPQADNGAPNVESSPRPMATASPEATQATPLAPAQPAGASNANPAPSPGAAEAPADVADAPDAGAPLPDAGSDAGGTDGALVGSD